MEEYNVGDVLSFQSWGYRHLALYIGNGCIVHHWPGPNSWFDCTVRVDTIREVMEAGCSPPKLYTSKLDEFMGIKPFSRDTILKRACGQLGAKGYNLVTNNCEHFVTWVRYGHAESPQIWLLALKGAIFLGVGAAVVTCASIVQTVAGSGALAAFRKRHGAMAASSFVFGAINWMIHGDKCGMHATLVTPPPQDQQALAKFVTEID